MKEGKGGGRGGGGVGVEVWYIITVKYFQG